MYLIITPDDARYWRGLSVRWEAPYSGSWRLSDRDACSARTRREEARALLAKDIDPSAAKKADETCRQARARKYV